jgi:xylulokinase
MGHDYILFRLCGQMVTDHSMAGGTMLYDLAGQDWCPELLSAFEIDRAQLPEIRWSGTPLGTMRPHVAAELGLSSETVVAVGGQDQKCAALGAYIHPGVATVSLGTASAISCLADRPLLDPQRRIPTFPFVVPGYWDLEGVVGTAGGALRWLRETFYPGRSYEELNAWAATSEPGANGVCFAPHLSGASAPHWRADTWGAWTGLSLSAGRGDMVRSVLEGVAFQIRRNLDVMQDIGLQVDEVVLFGGGAQSPLWAQILSDVADKPLRVTGMVDVANWGACLLAGIGAGLFAGGFAGLPRHREETGGVYQPQRAATARYQAIYRAYCAQEAKLLA